MLAVAINVSHSSTANRSNHYEDYWSVINFNVLEACMLW
jgi:hypothetical protein